MRTGNQRQAVVVVEGFRNVLAESVTGTTRRDSPAAAVVGVGPEEIAHGPLMRYLLDAVQGSDVVEGVDAGRKTTVQTEDLVVNQGSEGKVVE